MKKRPLLDVLLEIQKQSPDAHFYGDRALTIDSVIENLRHDLGPDGWLNAEAMKGPYYFLKEDHDHMYPMVGVWHDERDEPMMLFERESWSSRLSGRRGRGRGYGRGR